ncbi:2-succinyl-6-hydroxy-2,4-cyclohexadiene-1-carboxylate synthase [Chlorobium sp. N1]|uniref:2-succinyl-6-hydroxy-2, 4-cyclohexadiene-1-carboxylate synthase n=1 Tax=Chlorobium sp. N1 TaxID=2491138 RepID=UPI001039C541|nr:2-succinyl-6-hydroxy-2,4-cyclohexadiene-1-carboxylate synthase [Chlorobium sp. N1]TCD47904.1 2-succinyl-6-hydroxy-2,4-cyclohexadiene-1-carboxylate synthase [Chlorobium sp. N1]
MRSSEIQLTSVGREENPWILFLHGFLGAGSDWLGHARRLEADYCSLLVDLPGHGTAPVPEEGDPERYFTECVDAIADLVRRRGTPGFLVGYSMGGRIGLALSLRHPDLFSAAVIVSSSPGLKTEEERSARRRSDEGIARKIERNFGGFIEAWYQMPLFSTLKAHPLFGEIDSKRREGEPRKLAAALRLLGTGSQPPFWQMLPESRVPMLFMAGQKDAKYVEIGRQMVTLHSMSSLELFEGCGHTLHIEEREVFLRKLLDFFNQHQAFRS